MICKVTFSMRAKNQFEYLPKDESRTILNWLVSNIQGSEDPKTNGYPIRSDLGEYWKYQVGKYNLYCIVTEDRVVILSIEADRNSMDP